MTRVVVRPSRMSGRPVRISGSGRESLPDFWEWSGDHPGCPGDPFGCPRVVGRPSRISGSGREAHPDVREWSGGNPA